jgi:hypothetical protein
MTAFEVRRDDLRQTRFAEDSGGEGEGAVRIERFALTANNVTYGVMGDALSYWSFFPAAGEGWGRIPVWGIGTVLATGETIYGYFPMASHVSMRLDERLFERSGHRAELPATYNRYMKVAPDTPHLDEMLILRPLFGTSFLLADFLGDGDETIVLGSASSKTAYGLAALLSRRVVGLTSARNRGFVESLGVYDGVVTYDAAGALGDEGPIVFVDMSGDAGVIAAVHRDADVRRLVIVGVTHWEQAGGGGGEQPAGEFFFAPSHIEQMTERLGPEELQRRMGDAWDGLMGRVGGWMEIEHGSGPDHLERVWRSLVDGDVDPRRGHVVTLA